MSEVLKPTSDEQVREAVAWAASEEIPLEVVAMASKAELGRPMQTQHSLDLSDLSGITLYEPAELVLSARAGTPLSEIEAVLAESNQQLAFEPPDLGPLFGGASSGATLGGVVATNLAGPRRFKTGAARDHVLGVSAVSGRGETFKTGGRVVKNVTGYDLSKLLTGSYGTLAAMTEITIKVLPAPETSRTLLILGLKDSEGLKAMTLALQSAHEVSGAAHLPVQAVVALSSKVLPGGGRLAATALRLEGPSPSVDHRYQALRQLLAPLGRETAELDAEGSEAFWVSIRDLHAFTGSPDAVLWRLSVPPNEAFDLIQQLDPESRGTHVYDWGGGLIWFAPGEALDSASVHERSVSAGGQAMLFRAPVAMRARSSVFSPQPAAKFALTSRIKQNFDPKGILNPGRLYPGV